MSWHWNTTHKPNNKHIIVFNNLHVITVTLLGGPSPTIVCALRCNECIVSGDNPPTVYISTLLLMLIVWPLSEYCVITPLGGSGGIHCKVTEVELTETISSNRGTLGTTNTYNNNYEIS